MRILISASGSYGDLLPFAGLARGFVGRGHEVIFYTNPYFRPLVESVGARLVPLRTVEQYHAVLTTLADGNPLPVFRRVLSEYAAMSAEYHQAMRADVLPGQTLAIGCCGKPTGFPAPRSIWRLARSAPISGHRGWCRSWTGSGPTRRSS